MIDIHRELADAQALARDPRCAPAFDFPGDVAGAGYVALRKGLYQPDEAGEPAVIVAAEVEGDLVDLVACRLSDRAMGSRLGRAAILGEDYVSIARVTGCRLPLFRDAFHWALSGFVGAVVVDWRRARLHLDGLPAGITCASEDQARRVHAALATPLHIVARAA
jgi:hypothetical protein